MTLLGKPADQKDGRLMSLNNYRVSAWMPAAFI